MTGGERAGDPGPADVALWGGRVDRDRSSALAAAARWDLDPGSLRHLVTSANAVYAARRGAERCVVRVTRAGLRTLEDCRTELSVVAHLASAGVPVAAALPSRAGAWVEVVAPERYVSVFRWAPGRVARPRDGAWDPRAVHAWGRALGQIHLASASYRLPAGLPPRWTFEADPILRQHAALLRGDADAPLRRVLADVTAHLATLPIDDASYGLLHGDLGPQNFHVDDTGAITVFDFGNCCRHWFAHDLAIARGLLARVATPAADDAWRALREGYATVRPLPAGASVDLPWFEALRAVYVYLTRRWLFGDTPTPAQRARLADLRATALARAPL